jgi:hypothetical protein
LCQNGAIHIKEDKLYDLKEALEERNTEENIAKKID